MMDAACGESILCIACTVPACEHTLSHSVGTLDDVFKLLTLANAQAYCSVPASITCSRVKQTIATSCCISCHDLLDLC